MEFLTKMKDGGPESPVEGYFLFEIKYLGSIAILKFNKGCRENFHTHAFNAFTWFLFGDLEEEDVSGSFYKYTRSLWPKLTKRSKNHRVKAIEESWCFTIRGPWVKTWTEYNQPGKTTTLFTWGRKILGVTND